MATDEILKEKPSYYAIITAGVRYDKKLKTNEKIMYGEITALANKNGYCNASNEYFAELYGVHKVTVSNWISNLKSRGYIKIEMVYKKNTKQIQERRLIIDDTPISENTNTYKRKDLHPINEITNTPISENTKDNNTSNNTTSINNIPPIVPQGEEEVEILINTDVMFKIFWEEYPKKKSKGEALKSFKKIKPNEELFQIIISQLKLFKKTKEWKKDKGQFIPHPATWLNQKRWEDEIDESEFEKTNEQKIEKAKELMRYR